MSSPRVFQGRQGGVNLMREDPARLQFINPYDSVRSNKDMMANSFRNYIIRRKTK